MYGKENSISVLEGKRTQRLGENTFVAEHRRVDSGWEKIIL